MKNLILTITLVATLISCENEKKGTPGLCLSFDDRSINEWFKMSKLLDEYDAKVTFFVSRFDSLTPLEINILRELERKGHEIGSHGAIHVNSEFYIEETSYGEYLDNEIDHSIFSMNKNGFHPKSFAYPYGAKYWFTDFLLLKRFDMIRGVIAINHQKDITLIDEIYYKHDGSRTVSALGIDMNSGLTNKMIEDGMRRVINKNEVLLLYGHVPLKDTLVHPYEFDIDLLEFILREAQKNNLKYFKIGELANGG